MSSISTIPPLLCNTPPPMDFGDEDEDGDSVLPNDLSLDDEEIGTYKVLTVSQPQADSSNTNVPPLIESSVHVNSTKLPNTGKSNILNIENEVNVKTPPRPIEAFNLAISSAFLGSSSPPPMEFDYATPPTFDQYDDNEDDDEEFTDFYNTPVFDCDENNRKEINNEKVEEEEEIDSQKNEDNISLPSLKFDTLSINSDNLSGCSPTPLSHIDEGNAEVSENKEESQEKSLDGDSRSSPYTLPQLPEDLVKMEDVLDDSSDEETHSPKRKNNIKEDENTVDFFAIHTVDDSSPNLDTLDINISDCEIKQKIIDNDTSKENNNNSVGTTCSIPELDKDILKHDDDFDSFTDFTDFQTPETPVETPSAEVYQVAPQQTECSDFDADFNDFVTTSELVTSTTNAEDKETAINLEMPKTNVQSSDGHGDDDFDDFQDFTDASSVQQTDSKKKEEPENVSQAIDTDDEFGEFTDVSPTEVSVTASKLPTYITISSTVNIQDLNGKLNAILNMMFPSENKNPVEDIANVKLQLSEKADEQYLKLDSIDAAKALDYQWTKSEVRHSLIRSLGIDSRNILFGEKWNSSMPRYATSLKPLEPLKPQQVAQHGSISNDATHSNSKDRSVKTLKSDVPAVEFDWNSSGLVNPLDGTQEDLHKRETETIHTSQLGSADEPIGQQSSYSTLAANDSFSKLTDNVNNNNSTPATSTALNTAATATLSSNVPTDSISHNINDISFITDIGISNPSTSLSSFVAASRETKIEIIQQQLTTTTDLPYNLSSTLRNTKVVPGIIDDEVVATSTFAGPLKETHIYTPSKIDAAVGSKAGLNSTNKSTVPIDFDYEIAAAGIIIDETVVKKEYRDIEYNPGFSLDLTKTQSIDLPTNSDKVTIDDDFFGPLQYEAPTSGTFNNLASKTDSKVTIAADAAADIDDEFSDFQSVLPPMENTQVQSFNKAPQVAAALVPRTKELASGTDKTSRTSTPTLGGGSEMILSPAILLPQAISIESSKPKIEWGEAVASINPDELARIEELFPQPKSESGNLKKTPTIANGYQNQDTNKSLSISATIAEKEQNVDDDDWSEFVSVPAVPEMYVQHKLQLQTQSQNNASNNNNNQFSTNTKRQQQQRQQTNHNVVQVAKPINASVSSAEEEWSDFVSSAPPPHTAMPYRAMPQFNSAAWKNANFYNNPLSFYQNQTQMQSQTQTHSNLVPKFNHQNNNSDANLSYNNNNSKYNQQQQLQQQQQQHQQHAQQQLQLQQQIHIMQDFSTAPPSLHRLTNAAPVPNHHSSNTQFQVGSAKVAPSISLIPDLGFIAPAATTHTAFINTLPKPTLMTKK